MLFQLHDPKSTKLSDYDCIIQCILKDVEDFKRMKADPRFLEKVAPGVADFADTTRTTYVLLYTPC